MKKALILAALLNAAPALAVEPDEILADPALEHRARALSTELRCVVCQNQSIDDSEAPLARDLRLLLRERLQAGDSDEAAKAYLVARYGDFVLLKPPFNTTTLFLWLGPFLVLAAGILYLLLNRRRQASPAEAPISAEEAEKLKKLI